MILGIGVDLLNVNRIEKTFLKFQSRFVRKILSEDEIKEFKQSKKQINFLAKRFCAKEAFSKALGTGIGRGINMSDITIAKDILGKPIITLSDSGYVSVEKLFKLNIEKIQFNISISDEIPYVNCFVVISANL